MLFTICIQFNGILLFVYLYAFLRAHQKERRAYALEKNMIKVENLVKRYGNNYALNDVSFEIGEGEVVGLLGPNGAGKSTAMNILTGYLAATSGRAYIDGVDIVESPLQAKRNIGYLPEQPPVYPDMTVEEYLKFVYDLKGCTVAPREAHLEEIMDVVRVRDVRSRLIRNLSKGYRQRVGIAQALVGDPKILIFDEPTVGLDPKQILEVRNLIRQLGKNHTVILSTHILSEVQAVCERVVIINRGRIIANEKTEDLTRAIAENAHYLYHVIGAQSAVLSLLRAQNGVLSVTATTERDGDAVVYLVETTAGGEARRAIFSACAEKNFPIVGISETGNDLESIFIRLIDRANGDERKPKPKNRA